VFFQQYTVRNPIITTLIERKPSAEGVRRSFYCKEFGGGVIDCGYSLLLLLITGLSRIEIDNYSSHGILQTEIATGISQYGRDLKHIAEADKIKSEKNIKNGKCGILSEDHLMNEHEVRKLIARLLEEIKSNQMTNRKDQELLDKLESEIREFLDQAEKNGGKIHPAAMKSLQDGLSRFETSHQLLTALISQIMDALSGTGI
jgi:hypothetical protein